MSRDGENLYCPVCGSVQEDKNQFCASCGNDLKPGVNKSAIQTQTYGSTPQQEYIPPSKISTEGGALVIAVYLAFIGCFTGCFILPIVGLYLVKTAVNNNEDEKNIRYAKKVNIASLILTILILIGTVLAITLPLILFL